MDFLYKSNKGILELIFIYFVFFSIFDLKLFQQNDIDLQFPPNIQAIFQLRLIELIDYFNFKYQKLFKVICHFLQSFFLEFCYIRKKLTWSLANLPIYLFLTITLKGLKLSLKYPCSQVHIFPFCHNLLQ